MKKDLRDPSQWALFRGANEDLMPIPQLYPLYISCHALCTEALSSQVPATA